MNIGSLLGAMASLLPNYIQGRQHAIRDNWQDLKNYNDVQAGQFANAFTEETWWPRVQMFYDQSARSGLGVLNDAMATGVRSAWFPTQVYQGAVSGMYAPYLAHQNYMGQMIANDWLMRNWNNPAANQPQMMLGGGMNQPPSVVR